MRTRARLAVDLLHGCIAAFQFLSRIPIPVSITYNEAVFRRSVVFYPVVGGVIGLLLAGGGYVLESLMPPIPAAALLTVFYVLLSGGLHLDGLMDTADGILSHRPREQMLEIMKDSRVGAMGAIACGLQLLVLFSAFAALQDGHWNGSAGLIAAAPVWSRWFMVIAITCWPYARREPKDKPGMGALFRGIGPKHVLACSLAALIVSSGVLVLLGSGFREAVFDTAVYCLAAGLLGAGLSAYISAKLGGLTGDTYGAANELLQAAFLIGIVVAVYH